MSPEDLIIDQAIVRRWLLCARDLLAEHREEIDALNIFPVPDGDTGTNLSLTVEAAVRGLADVTAEGLADALAGAARGAFLGARGNSGVIFSEMLRGVADVLGSTGDRSPSRADFAHALTNGAERGYRAVLHPKEGTMLTVMRRAAEAAEAAVVADEPLHIVAHRAMTTAEAAVLETREQLDVLRDAGVVDAGGRGLALVLEAMELAMTGRPRRPADRTLTDLTLPTISGMADGGAGPHSDHAHDPDGPAYEVMYLLDAPDDRIGALREALDELPGADSQLVVGGDGLWNVHVHVDDVGAAIELGISVGRPFQIRVTHFASQVAATKHRRAGRAVVAVAAGEGMGELFASAGARTVLGYPTAPSTAEILREIRASNCTEVIVLPNDRNVVSSAKAAAREAERDGCRVAVIPTRAQVQGLAALAMHDPESPFDSDVVTMSTTAGHVRQGAVTIAVKEAQTSAGPCRPGDVLGIVEGDFAFIDSDLVRCGLQVVNRMLALGGGLVTIIVGADTDPEHGAGLEALVGLTHPQVEVVRYQGGPDRYAFLLGVE